MNIKQLLRKIVLKLRGEIEAVDDDLQSAKSDISGLQSGKVDKVTGKQLSTNDYTSAEKNKLEGIEAGAEVNTVTSVAGKTGAVSLVKADVGLGNVDNTSDADKPISTATQAALDGKADADDTYTKQEVDDAIADAQAEATAVIIDVGSYQETVGTKVFPKIPLDIANNIYDTYTGGKAVIISWKVMGVIPVEATVIGSDSVGSTKSFTVFIHNTYNVDYTYDATTEDFATMEVIDLKALKTVEGSDVNGNIKIDGDEVKVYNDEKVLYNLGAFDTVVDNEDGTVTITRQTGYADLGKLAWGNDENNTYYSDSLSQVIELGTHPDAKGNIACSALEVKIWYDVYYNSQVGISLYTNGNLSVKYDDNRSPSAFKSAMTGVVLQYKLAASYTEKAIKNQPLSTLPQDGEQWLRGQWEKSTNMLNIPNATRSSSGYYLGGGNTFDKCMDFYLPAGTYTLSAKFSGNAAQQDNEFGVFDASGNRIVATDLGRYTADLLLTFTISVPAARCFLYVSMAGTISNFMINKGNKALPYKPYNANKHITNEQADLLKQKWLDGVNLANTSKISGYRIVGVYLEKGHSYTLSNFEFNSIVLYKTGTDDNAGQFSDNAFVFSGASGYYDIACILLGQWVNFDNVSNVMLNEGTEAKPYVPYNAKEHITNEQADLLRAEEEKSRNLFDKNKATDNYYLWYGNNNAVQQNGCFYSDYIAVEPGTSYSSTVFSFTLFYDNSKNYISGIDYANSFVTPSNCAYIRLSYGNGYLSTKNYAMVNKGSVALPYSEYQGKILHEADGNGALLWQNPSPSSSFASQTISIPSVVNYKYVIIHYRGDGLDDFRKVPRGRAGTLSIVAGASGLYVKTRSFNFTNQTSIIFYNAYDTDVLGRTRAQSDSAIVPLEIYGTNIL